MPEAKVSMAKHIKSLALPNIKDVNIVGDVRLMESRDIPQVYQLYKKHYDNYLCHFKFS